MEWIALFIAVLSLYLALKNVGPSVQVNQNHIDLKALTDKLQKILEAVQPIVAEKIVFFTIIDGKKEKVDEMLMKVTENRKFSIKPVDAKGNLAKVDGAPTWAVTDESLATLEVAEDGMSAVVKPVGPLGTFSVQVKADADLGEGVAEIMGELAVELVAGDAVAIAISADEVV